jgi:signal transduction histidine kinase
MVYFLIFSIIPLIIVGFMAYENGKKAIEKQAFNSLTTTTTLKEEELNNWIAENEREIQLLARSPVVQKNSVRLITHIKTDPVYLRAYEEMSEYFKTVEEKDPDFFEIFLLDPEEGKIQVSTDKKREGEDKFEMPYFIEGKKDTYVQDVYFSPDFSRPLMTIATPVKAEEGNVVGVLAGRVDLKEMDKIMQEITGLGETGETYLVSKYHFFVSDPRFKAGYPLKKEIHTEGVDNCLRHNSGVGLYNNYKGVPVIGSYRWMEDRELCILAEIEQAEAFAPIYSLRKAIFTMGIIIAGVVLVVVAFLARTITMPIQQLVSGAERIGKGDLSHRIDVKTKDEIGVLAESFNTMVKNLEETQRQLIQSEKLASLGQLAAGVAHEINNPLANISLNAQMLSEDAKEDATTRKLKVIEDNVGKAARIVRNLLDFSRAPEFRPESVDVNVLLSKTLDILKHETKNIEVIKDFGSPLPEIIADPVQLQQVFTNIITNACQAMPTGGKLTIATRSMGNVFEVSFADTGHGIPKEHIRKIFDPFFTTRKIGKGTGLGLSICYRIIERHNGRIDVESEVGKGSTFTIKLPIESRGIPKNRRW